jgi:hypothetical protein
MASKKPESDSKKDQYKPKATARHAKIVKTRQEEIDDFKAKIANDKHLAKKYEAKRKEEIKALPKEDRREAKADLRESIQSRKEAERRDKALLRDMVSGEREAKRSATGEVLNEDEWVKGGRKKKSTKSEAAVAPVVEPIPDTVPEVESAMDPANEAVQEEKVVDEAIASEAPEEKLPE